MKTELMKPAPFPKAWSAAAKPLTLAAALLLGCNPPDASVAPYAGAAQNAAAPATIQVSAASVIRERTGNIGGIGGVNISAHENSFATDADGIPYRADLQKAGSRLVRTVAFPDYRRPTHQIGYFDANVAAVLAAGAKPLFVAYLNPNPVLFNADGTPGGTAASNVVYLVNRYAAAPYNLSQQYWEIGNEPDNSVDYPMTPTQYTAAFNAVHQALVAAGVRNKVVLCGPATASDFGFNAKATAIMNQFLVDCRASVDVVTRHIYNTYTNADVVLNQSVFNAATWDPTPNTASHGEYKLQQAMNAAGMPATVSTGITEYNTTNFRHQIVQGLWNLKALHYALYNPRMRLTTGFVFDAYNTQQGGLGFYDSVKTRDFNYWAHYINHRLRGFRVLRCSSSDPRLTVTATHTPWVGDYFVEVINTGATGLESSVALAEVDSLRATKLFQLSKTVNTLRTGEAVAAPYGRNFTYVFPPRSVTIFRFVPPGTN